ncbi:hypothetical protein ACFL3H_08570 [Gemmatimonadota bacterium]
MNPLMLIMVVRLMIAGPIADHRWMEITGDLLADAELRLPEPRYGTGTRIWLRHAEGEGSLSLQTSLDPSFSLLNASCRVRVDRTSKGNRLFSSVEPPMYHGTIRSVGSWVSPRTHPERSTT